VIEQINSVLNDFFYLLWVSAYGPTHGRFKLYFPQGFDPSSAWVLFSQKTSKSFNQSIQRTILSLQKPQSTILFCVILDMYFLVLKYWPRQRKTFTVMS
jgi:hypothetical protein